jgi:hypothetical protein
MKSFKFKSSAVRSSRAFADATILIWDFYECQMVYDAHVSKNQPLPQIVHARSQAG